jgi:hypothetical protein
MAVSFSYHVTVWINVYAMKVQLSNTTNLSDIHSVFASMLDTSQMIHYQTIHKQKQQHNKLRSQTFLQIS